MNRNFYNKATINDINWFLVVENLAKGTTDKELYNILKNPYPPISVNINARDNCSAVAFYRNMKDVNLIINSIIIVFYINFFYSYSLFII